MKPSEWIATRTRELDEDSIVVRPLEHWRTIAIAEWLDEHLFEKGRDTEPRPPCFPSVMAADVDDGAHAETALHVTGPEPLGVPSGANGPSEAE